MLKMLPFIGLLLLSAIRVDAKILRVGIDYENFTVAHNAAAAGDTLQIYGSQNGTATKRLVIMGFGYNFDVHPGLQAIGTESPSQLTITFQTGSDSSIIEGVDANIYTYVSNINVIRCRTTVYLYNYSQSINNIKIISCVFEGGGMSYSNYTCSNLLLYNCILAGSLSMSYFANGAGSSGAVINCVTVAPTITSISLNLGQASFLVKNNIMGYSSSSSNTSTVYESNFFAESQPGTLPQGSNNRWSQSWSDLFNRLGGANDQPSYYGYASFDENYFILKAGSAAINGGTNASGNPTDAGIFGGEPVYVYKSSGVPAIPSIYKLTAPSSAATTNPYNVTLSVRSNN